MRRISSILTLMLGLLLSAGGCATTVRPEARPIDPVPVFLTDYGVHSSLMLPTPEGRYVEYSFGDFGYAALNRGGPHNALGALFASGQSGIGRRFLSIRPGDETPRPAYAPKSFQKLYANRFQIYVLVKELDQRYRRGEDEPVHNPITDNVFVKDSEHYSFANNCNHMTARMLRQLGCEVKGNTGASAFHVVGRQELPPTVEPDDVALRSPAPSTARGTTAAEKQPPTQSASYTKIDLN